MWSPVHAQPILVSKEVQYVKIDAEQMEGRLSDITLLYLVTGSIYFLPNISSLLLTCDSSSSC